MSLNLKIGVVVKGTEPMSLKLTFVHLFLESNFLVLVSYLYSFSDESDLKISKYSDLQIVCSLLLRN